jgi:hypothetical protein
MPNLTSDYDSWKVYVRIQKHKNVFLMIDRCILEDTKVFESFFNAFGCIYSILHCIGSIFQCNSMHLYYISMHFYVIESI